MRVRIAPIEAWIDAEGNRRSAFERFNVLSDVSRHRLDQGGHDLVPWELSLMSDDSIVRDAAKVMTPASGTAHAYHAVDVEQADGLAGSARRLWEILDSSLPGAERIGFVAKDFFSSNEGESQDLRGAFGRAWSEQGVVLRPTSKPALFVAVARRISVQQCLATWWPSLAGYFCAMSFGSEQEALQDAVAKGQVDEYRLGSLVWSAETSTSYRNLGFRILTSIADRERIVAAWRAAGWDDWSPALTMMGLQPHQGTSQSRASTL